MSVHCDGHAATLQRSQGSPQTQGGMCSRRIPTQARLPPASMNLFVRRRSPSRCLAMPWPACTICCTSPASAGGNAGARALRFLRLAALLEALSKMSIHRPTVACPYRPKLPNSTASAARSSRVMSWVCRQQPGRALSSLPFCPRQPVARRKRFHACRASPRWQPPPHAAPANHRHPSYCALAPLGLVCSDMNTRQTSGASRPHLLDSCWPSRPITAP